MAEKRPSSQSPAETPGIRRRDFLQLGLGATAGLLAGKPVLAALKLVQDIENPMDHYRMRI